MVRVAYGAPMPLTFFAHQAPVLPIARRWRGRIDGVTLVIGSMAPDMAYVLDGSRFSLWAHELPWLVVFCVPVTLVVSWLVARVISPVMWDHLPAMGPFRLHDYRGLGAHRFRWASAIAGALIGALSHVALDHFTHDWGWFARNVDWYSSVLVDDVLGRRWTVFGVLQYAGHVVGSVLCCWMLLRLGRERWMAAAAERVRRYPVSLRSTVVLAAGTAAGAAAGVAWALGASAGSASAILRAAGVTFVALAATSASLRAPRRPYGP